VSTFQIGDKVRYKVTGETTTVIPYRKISGPDDGARIWTELYGGTHASVEDFELVERANPIEKVFEVVIPVGTKFGAEQVLRLLEQDNPGIEAYVREAAK
jgi:hypothetical protein